MLNNIQGIFLLWHKVLGCEEVSQCSSLCLLTLLGICYLFTCSSDSGMSELNPAFDCFTYLQVLPHDNFLELRLLFYLHKLGTSSYLYWIGITKKDY